MTALEGGRDNGPMQPLLYVDQSDIRPGRAAELEAAARELVEYVATHERQALLYEIYFSDDRSRMTVVHLHPNTDSLERLLAVIAPVLAPFRDLLQLRSIDIYGSPSEAVIAQVRAKAQLLGGEITIHSRVAGTESEILARSGSAG